MTSAQARYLAKHYGTADRWPAGMRETPRGGLEWPHPLPGYPGNWLYLAPNGRRSGTWYGSRAEAEERALARSGSEP